VLLEQLHACWDEVDGGVFPSLGNKAPPRSCEDGGRHRFQNKLEDRAKLLCQNLRTRASNLRKVMEKFNVKLLVEHARGAHRPSV